MKTKEEIDELYHKCWDDFISKHDDTFHYYSFVEGYTQCQEDMVDKKYTEEDVINLMSMATKWDTFKDGDVEYEMNMNDFFKYLINSLNKQD